MDESRSHSRNSIANQVWYALLAILAVTLLVLGSIGFFQTTEKPANAGRAIHDAFGQVKKTAAGFRMYAYKIDPETGEPTPVMYVPNVAGTQEHYYFGTLDSRTGQFIPNSTEEIPWFCRNGFWNAAHAILHSLTPAGADQINSYTARFSGKTEIGLGFFVPIWTFEVTPESRPRLVSVAEVISGLTLSAVVASALLKRARAPEPAPRFPETHNNAPTDKAPVRPT